MKYYTTLILFLLNIAFFSCKEETLNDGKIKILLENKMPYVNRIESELSSLSPIDDEILSGLFSKGYEPFLKAAETHVFNNIEHNDHFKIAEEMMKLCQIENYIPYLLANAMDDNLYATSFYGIFTDPQTNKSKFIVVIGQKKDIVSTTSDWILIDFKEEFDFYKGYSISFGHYGPYLDNYNGETHISKLVPNNFSSYQSNNVYKFLFVLTFKFLNEFIKQE